MAFSRGEPDWGAHLADELERIVDLHDASTVAAVIVEPVAGSIGVYPPPKGYLKRLREICDRHGILLIFDEVITGFGRVGAAFASERFGVRPDMMTVAKGPHQRHGAGLRRDHAQGHLRHLHDRPGVDGRTDARLHVLGHPLAVAAGLATLDIYRDEGLFERSAELAPKFEDALHSLRDKPNVIDTRNIGLMGAVELAPREGEPGRRGYEAFIDGWQNGVYCRYTADTLAFSPPLIVTEDQIDEIFDIVGKALDRTA